MTGAPVVTFLSDYGLEDEFVGVCHGVMFAIAPHVSIVDIHHNIRRHDVRQGALVLGQSVRFMPPGVHLAVVDPGVGSERKALALQTSSGAVLVGPDNGLLVPAATACGGIERAVEIRNEAFLLTPVSSTFHGRDVFAPAAAHVAGGLDPVELGPTVPSGELVPIELTHALAGAGSVRAQVLQIDRFGNVQLDARRSDLVTAGLGESAELEVQVEGRRLRVPLAKTFAAVERGELVLVEDSYGYLALAVNRGDAGLQLGARPGSRVVLGAGQ